MVVNVDPRAVQEGIVILPEQLGLAPAIAVATCSTASATTGG